MASPAIGRHSLAMRSPHDTGRYCEDLAADRLVSDGWIVLDRNFRDGPREIDLIARRRGTVIFVEVKGRADARHHHPLQSIGPAKRRDLARAARRWIRAYGRPGECYRFDAMSVIGPQTAHPLIEHVEDAWWL
jgi:putative endonuclease